MDMIFIRLTKNGNHRLSMFFNSWLGLKVDYKNEIIFDPYRSKKYKDYHARLDRVFKELFRIIK